MSFEGIGSFVVVSLVMEGNGQRIGISYSISYHPTVASVDLTDRVLLLGKVETKIWSFFFMGFREGGCFETISQGEGGHSSTIIQGGNYGMLGSDIICTSSLIK